jgi:hypothetical protein
VLAADSLAEINPLIVQVQITLDDGRSVKLDICGGCDLSNGNDINCISSCMPLGPNPCLWCGVKKKNLDPIEKYATSPTRRTLQRIGLLAHTDHECGTCPGCHMEIVDTQDAVRDPSKQMVKANVCDAVRTVERPVVRVSAERSKDETYLAGRAFRCCIRATPAGEGAGFEVVHLPFSFQPSHYWRLRQRASIHCSQ